MSGERSFFQAGDPAYTQVDDGEVMRLRGSSMLRAPAMELAGWVCRALGNDGLGLWDSPRRGLRLIHSVAREADGEVWAHVSVSRRDRQLPTWDQLLVVKDLVLGPQALALMVMPPEDEYVHGPGPTGEAMAQQAEVHHLWHCLTRRPTPDFRRGGGTL